MSYRSCANRHHFWCILCIIIAWECAILPHCGTSKTATPPLYKQSTNTPFTYNYGLRSYHSNTGEIGDEKYSVGDSYFNDFDEEWAKLSGHVHQPTCVDIPSNLSLCQNVGYDRMRLPNLLQHDSLPEVTQQAKSWVPLVGLHCHPDTKIFLCSLFSPVCLDRQIYPCRSLCESVRDNCLQRMIPYGFDWPTMLRCDRFPVDNDMCIKPIHDVKPDNNCSACRHPSTHASIIDNYCRAQFVIRVVIRGTDHHELSEQALLLDANKRFYKKDNLTRLERSVMKPILKGVGCTCVSHNNSSKPYLIMGVREGSELVVKYVVEFHRQNKDFRLAFSDIRKGNVCKSIIQELSLNELGQQEVFKAKIRAIRPKDGHKLIVMTKSRKNFKKGAITKEEEKRMLPFLEGKEGCDCDMLSNTKSRFLLFGSRREDDKQFYINYVIEYVKEDEEFRKGMKAIRKGDTCLGILDRVGSNVDSRESNKQYKTERKSYRRKNKNSKIKDKRRKNQSKKNKSEIRRKSHRRKDAKDKVSNVDMVKSKYRRQYQTMK